MLDKINQALQVYETKWQQLTADNPDVSVLQDCKPNAVGWKMADAAEYATAYAELRELCDVTVETWMNGRWIAKLHLKDQALANGTRIIKLMQRRPESDDALGLDHVDFDCQSMQQAETEFQAQQAIKWSWETNDVVDNYRWISLWFDGTEAKIKDYGVIDIVIRELQELPQ